MRRREFMMLFGAAAAAWSPQAQPHRRAIPLFGFVGSAKRLQLLRELVPNASAVGLLVNPNNTNSELESADVQAGGRTIGLQTHLLEASTSEEVDKAFASLTELKASALVVNADPLFIQLRSQFIALAARYSVPTIYYAR